MVGGCVKIGVGVGTGIGGRVVVVGAAPLLNEG